MAFSVGELVGYLRLEGGAAFDRQVSSAKRSLDLTGESATKAGAAIGRTETKLVGAGRASSTLAAESGKLRAAQLSVTAAQERYNALMAAGTGNTARLASAEAALIRSQLRLAAVKPAADPGGFARMREGAVSTVATLGKLGLAFGAFELAVKGVEMVKSGNELTTALNAVSAASNATDAQMSRARAAAIGLGKDLTVPKATAVDAAVAMEDLVRAGVSLDRAMVAARPALLLAAAAQVKIADAARVTGDVMDDFRLKADQAGHVANVLAAGATSAGGGLMDLFDGMKYAGPTARTLGVDVDMTTAALVLMAKSGHQGSIGGTAFANMLTRLAPVSKSAKNAMAELGVSAWDAQGKFKGLPVVVDQLHKAQERLSPEAFAKNVQIAFGNRARLAVFDFAHGGAAALDVFYKKMQAGDVQEYANRMNRGLSAAGAQLRKEFTAWAIDLNQKVQPALAKAAFWLGDSLPGAVRGLQNTLQPLEQELATVFVPAWHVLATTLGVVSTGLGEVAGLLERHKGTVQVVGTVVLGMWAAWKGYTIARTAVLAVSAAFEVLRNRAELAGESMAAIRAGEATIGAGTLALGGLGLALGVAAFAWQKHQAAVAANKQAIQSYTEAIKADSGWIADHSRVVAIDALQTSGAFDAARKLGLALSEVTDSALGNVPALTKVNTAILDGMAIRTAADGITPIVDEDRYRAAKKLSEALNGNNRQLRDGIQVAKNQAEANGKSTASIGEQKSAVDALRPSLKWIVDASGNLSQVQVDASGKVNDTTEEMVKQATAAELLKSALDALNGVAVSQEQTTNAFLDSLDSLTESVKTNGASLNQHSAAGRKNRETIVSIIQAAKDQAQATANTAAKTMDQTAALRAGNAQLKKNEDSLRAQAAKLGLSKDATDALIKSLGRLSTLHPAPTVDANTEPANAKANALKVKLDALTKQRTAAVAVNDGAATPRLTAIQAQMDAIDGRIAHASVQISVKSLDTGRALQDATNRAASSASGGWSSQVLVPGGHTPAHAAGGGVADGWFTMNERGWELGHKDGNNLQLYSHEQSKKMLPQGPSVPAYAAGTSPAVPAYASGTTASRTTTPYEYDGIYYATALAATNARTRALRKAPKAAPVHIDTIVETAGHGAAYGIASYIRGAIPSVRRATQLLSAAVDDAFKLKGVQAKVAGIRADLTKLRDQQSQLASNAAGKLADGSDPSQFGSIQQYTAFLQAKASQNNRFTGEIKHLEHNKAIPADLLAKFAADGPSMALDSFAGASKRDVTALLRASAGFNSSVTGGTRQAASIYGPAIAKDTANLNKALAQSARTETAMAGVVLKLAQLVNKPVTIKLDGKTVATTKFVHDELQGVVDELRNVLVTGRHR